MTGADFLKLHEGGLSYGQIAKLHGVTRNAVSGLIYRARHPHVKRSGLAKSFRDPDFVRSCVGLADAVGLMRAARSLGMDAGQLCRWRKRLRMIEAAN